MGRGQKLMNSGGKACRQGRENAPSKNQVEGLKAVKMTSNQISRNSVAAHALATFGSPEKAQHWMNRPNALFDGKTPAQVIESDVIAVEAELVRIDHGVYM